MRPAHRVRAALAALTITAAATLAPATQAAKDLGTRHLNGMYLTVTARQVVRNYGQFYAAPPGYKLLTLYLRAQNRNDLEQYISQEAIDLHTPDGIWISAENRSPAPRFVTTRLLPGQSVKGSMTFQIPTGVHQVVLDWTLDTIPTGTSGASADWTLSF